MASRMIKDMNEWTSYGDLTSAQTESLRRWAKRQNDFMWQLSGKPTPIIFLCYMAAKTESPAVLGRLFREFRDHTSAALRQDVVDAADYIKTEAQSSYIRMIARDAAVRELEETYEEESLTVTKDDPVYTRPEEKVEETFHKADGGAALKALGDLVGALAKNSMDEDRVVELVKQHAPKAEEITLPSPTVKVQTETKEIALTEKPRHKAFARLLSLVRKVNILMVGPAGGGKTTMGQQLAEAFTEITGDDWRFFHSTRITHESQLLGYNDATGSFVDNEFHRAYTRPNSIFMLDEMDGTVPDAQVALNTAVEGGRCPFACGTVEMAENVIVMGSANTYGFGANAQYVGRYPLDGAFKNRWAMFNLDYDEALERMLARNEAEKYGHAQTLADAWVDHVQKLRAAKDGVGALHIISPRASIGGARCLELAFDELDDLFIWQGLDEATTNKIKAAA